MHPPNFDFIQLQTEGKIYLFSKFLFVFVFFPVKYLREVTPYFRRSTIIGEVGWDTPSPYIIKEPGANAQVTRNHWTEMKVIPLKLCYVTRNLTVNDPDQRTVELHSPDGRSSCLLRCTDTTSSNEWFSALHANVSLLAIQAVSEANDILRSAPGSREVKHMGWLCEQVRLDLTKKCLGKSSFNS